jgi:hypothetical protein
MKKNLPLYLYGTIMIGEGALLMLSQNSTLETVKFILGIGLIIGSMLAFFTAFSRERRQVQFAYPEIHALTMLVYGTYILFFCKTLENLTNVTAFLLLFYPFKDIIFCNWLFNLGQKVLFKILFIRLFLGLLIGVGTITSLYYQDINLEGTIRGCGVIFMIIGINVLLYVPIIKSE